jgi:hypothetical protein
MASLQSKDTEYLRYLVGGSALLLLPLLIYRVTRRDANPPQTRIRRVSGYTGKVMHA